MDISAVLFGKHARKYPNRRIMGLILTGTKGDIPGPVGKSVMIDSEASRTSFYARKTKLRGNKGEGEIMGDGRKRKRTKEKRAKEDIKNGEGEGRDQERTRQQREVKKLRERIGGKKKIENGRDGKGIK